MIISAKFLFGATETDSILEELWSWDPKELHECYVKFFGLEIALLNATKENPARVLT